MLLRTYEKKKIECVWGKKTTCRKKSLPLYLAKKPQCKMVAVSNRYWLN